MVQIFVNSLLFFRYSITDWNAWELDSEMKAGGLLESIIGIKILWRGKREAKISTGISRTGMQFHWTSQLTLWKFRKWVDSTELLELRKQSRGLSAGSTPSNCGNRLFIPDGRIRVHRVSTFRIYLTQVL